ncbi:MAG: hypothetical protein ACK5Z2_17035 [Bacteroidota bacterium]|jgi:hypothetical protein
MKKLIAFGLLTISLMSYAQQVKIKWGEPLETSAKITSFMAHKDDKVYTLSVKKDDYYIECFNKDNYSKLFSTKLEIPRIVNKKQEIEEILFSGNQFTIFTSYYDRTEKKFRLNAYNINMQGVINPKPLELLKLEAESKNDIGKILFRISPDSSCILITHTYTKQKTTENHLAFFVLDRELNVISNSDMIVPSKTGNAYNILMDCYISNKRELFLTELKLTRATQQQDANLEYSIIKYSEQGKEISRIPVELDGKRIISMELQFNSKQELMIYGHYNKSPNPKDYYFNAYNGTYFIVYNTETDAQISKSTFDFEQEMINNYYTQKQLKNGDIKYLGVNYRSGSVKEKESGGYVIVYEEYNIQFNQGPNGASSQTYYYGDLTVVNLDPKGEIKWVKMVPKRQYFIRKQGPLGIGFGPVMITTSVNLNDDESIYYSYTIVVKDEQIFLIYNDLPVNAEVMSPRNQKVLKKIKGTVPVVAILNENGEMRKKLLTEMAGTDVNLCPRVALEMTNNAILVYGSKGNDYKIGTLIIQ